MIKVFYKEISHLRPIPLIFFQHREESEKFKNLISRQKALSQIQEPFVERVENIEQADFVLIPHVYREVRKDEEYLKEMNQLAADNKKRIILFAFQDDPTPIRWPQAIIFRVSTYASEMMDNEFIIPYAVEDLCFQTEPEYRNLPTVPVVGFVGWAGFDSVKQRIKSALKEFYFHINHLLRNGSTLGVKRKGLYLRMEMVKILSRAKGVKTNFIIRKKFSGRIDGQDKQDVERIRTEYIENIKNSDVTLSPRGEGNASQRFYEVLSMGRIPLLIDTDNRLPFEETIPYHRFVIRVPYKKRKEVDNYINEFFSSLDEEEYKKRQKEARYYYDKYLSINGFYRYLFRDGYVEDLVKIVDKENV